MGVSRNKLYRIPQACEYINGVLSDKTLRNWVWRGLIPVVRIGGAVCISEATLDSLLMGELPVKSRKGTRKIPRGPARKSKSIQ